MASAQAYVGNGGGLFIPPASPVGSSFRVPTAPYTAAIPDIIPREASSALMRLDEAVGISPGAYMAPNWTYPCGPNGLQQCYTEVATAGAAFEASTIAQSSRAIDAVTRGLLSGLQPIISSTEMSVFNDGDEGVRSA